MRPLAGLALAALAVVALALASCAGPRAATVARAERSDGSTIEHRMRIQGYVSRDGVVHAWPGTVEPAGPDSLRLVLPREPEQGIVGGGHAGHVLVVARDEVWTVRRVSAAAPLMFMLLAVSAMVLIAYATSPPLTFFGN